MTASATWRRWSAVRVELAKLLAEQERQRRQSPVPAVRVGRRRYTEAAQLETIPAPGWTAISDEAAQRFRAMITSRVAQLNGAKPAPGAPNATAWRIRRLEQEARRLAADIQARPVTGAADVLARLDIIAAMWGDRTERSPSQGRRSPRCWRCWMRSPGPRQGFSRRGDAVGRSCKQRNGSRWGAGLVSNRPWAI